MQTPGDLLRSVGVQGLMREEKKKAQLIYLTIKLRDGFLSITLLQALGDRWGQIEWFNGVRKYSTKSSLFLAVSKHPVFSSSFLIFLCFPLEVFFNHKAILALPLLKFLREASTGIYKVQ